MIVHLSGTLAELSATRAVLDVGGVGFELGISAVTAQSLPAPGSTEVTLLTRMIVREDAQELYGFSSREERALFDRLRSISGVGPKLALATLSTFTPSQLAATVAAQDAARMASVPGVGKKTATRLIVELSDVFSKDAELRSLIGASDPGLAAPAAQTQTGVLADASDALLSMGFTPREIELALDGVEDAAASIEDVLGFALRRLGRSS